MASLCAPRVDSRTAAQGELLWRLGSQGYATASLPFVPWMLKRGFAADGLADAATLRRASAEWQQEFDQLVERTARGATGRPVGSLHVFRRHCSSATRRACCLWHDRLSPALWSLHGAVWALKSRISSRSRARMGH